MDKGKNKSKHNKKHIYIKAGATLLSIVLAASSLSGLPMPLSKSSASTGITAQAALNNYISQKVLIDGITYQEYSTYATVYKANTNLSGNIVLPDKVDGLPVTDIGSKAFENCEGIRSIVIGKNIKTIGLKAFIGCTGLTSVNLNNGLTTIDKSAFQGCSGIKTIGIPVTVQTIGDMAFEGCSSLTTITFKENTGKTQKNELTSFGTSCFANCTSLKGISFPAGISSMGDKCFQQCTNLQEVTLNNGLSAISVSAFESCAITELVIPNSVTSIGNKAFQGCTYLYELQMGDNVSSIGDYAFYECVNLESIECPPTVTKIGNYAFAKMTSLNNIHLGNASTIGKYCFEEDTSLKVLVFPDNLAKIEQRIITGTGMELDTVVLGKNTSYISDKAFYNTSSKNPVIIDTLIMPSGVKQIGELGFGARQTLKINKETDDTEYVMTYYAKINNIKYEGSEDELEILLEKSGQNGMLVTGDTSVGQYTYEDKAGTCKKYGTRYYTFDDDSSTETSLPKSKHQFQTYITPATTSKTGVQSNKCKVCGTVMTSEPIPKLSKVELEYTNTKYDGTVKHPKVKAYNADGALIPSTNYTVSYSSGCKEAGTHTVTVKFKNLYSGTISKTFSISVEQTPNFKVEVRDNNSCKFLWTKSYGASGYTLYYSTKKDVNLKELKTVSNAQCKEDGKNRYMVYITPSVKNLDNYYFYIKPYRTVNGKKIYGGSNYYRVIIGKVQLTSDSIVYNGKTQTPRVTAYGENGILLDKKYYEVEYGKGRKNIGSYTVKVSFKNGRCTGVVTKTFKIVPGKATNIKLSKKTVNKKSNTHITFNKLTSGGPYKYQIYYAEAVKAGKSGSSTKPGTYKKLAEISGNSYDTTKLTANKTYYFKVRAVKAVGNTTYCGAFSGAVKYKVQK